MIYSTKESVLSAIQGLIDLSGKKRFQNIFNVYSNLEDKEPKSLNYKYLISARDCWEATIFSDRLSNKGFNRNSSESVFYFMQDFVEIMTAAKKYNLI